MCRFIRLAYSSMLVDDTLRNIENSKQCYERYFRYLQDDFAPADFYSFLEKSFPFFWFIEDMNNNYMGFVFLDNFVGNGDTKFSAEVTTCMHPRSWGVFTKYCAKFFFKMCFDTFGLYKITANVFPDNFRVKSLLKSSGFIFEGFMPAATVRAGKVQGIDMYSLYRSYYYKNEVTDGDDRNK